MEKNFQEKKLVLAISRVSTPSTRKLCTQAKDFLDQAVQVIKVYIL